MKVKIEQKLIDPDCCFGCQVKIGGPMPQCALGYWYANPDAKRPQICKDKQGE